MFHMMIVVRAFVAFFHDLNIRKVIPLTENGLHDFRNDAFKHFV